MKYFKPSESLSVQIDAADRPLPIRDFSALKNALAETDPRVLLMVYSQLTGDDSLLAEFQPHIGSPLMGDSVLPEPLVDELRNRLQGVLAQRHPPVSPPISLARLKQLLTVFTAEVPGDEMLPMIVEQMGFHYVPSEFVEPPAATPPAGFTVLIIGAGVSSIAMAVSLAKAGYDFEIIEKSTDLGGVWHAARFPGVGVDTPSHIYSFSFDIKADWPRYFSAGGDVRTYLHGVAEKFGLKQHMRFNTTVESCTYDEATGEWQVAIRGADGQEAVRRCNVLINATGLFTTPQIPNFKGLENFKGQIVHTARWDNEVDFADKQVAMIGTGASALQVGPSIAPQTGRFTVFQRTAPWLYITPKQYQSVPGGALWAMRNIPYVKEWFRMLVYAGAGDAAFETVKVDPEWADQSKTVSMANAGFRMWLEAGIQQALAGREDLIERVTPNFPPFGKRVCQEFGWYGMLKRPNVELVTNGIDHITETSIVTQDGTEVPVDIIVMATGYGLMDGFQQLPTIGKNGVNLHDFWEEGNPRTHRGVAVPGFPNFFFLIGPNSVPTHGGGVNMTSEAQATYITRCIALLHQHQAKAIDVTPAAYDAYNQEVDAALLQRVWNHPAVSSYYLNSQRRNIASCPWRVVDYWHMMHELQPEEFALS
jgi:4-hydroxyacetophenone monooxygenase